MKARIHGYPDSYSYQCERGLILGVNITVCCPQADSHTQSAADSAGATAELAATRKTALAYHERGPMVYHF